MDEVKSLIEYYLALPQRIESLELALRAVSSRYYAAQSFTGCGLQGEFADVQRALSPEKAIVEILTDESIISTRLERARTRLRLFTDEFTVLEVTALKHELLAEYGASPLMMRVYDYIQEIEFYMTGHVLGVIPSDEMSNASMVDIEGMENELKELFAT
ncbi:hypothetical protein [uncultured Abiotrophia sp.]|uniref:hypothetical protein n=1 Tax=uncultured Abiotrophia sp. TaxID=316094 RepID=UPI0028DB6B30|nr:hypothetical protein [uncultured Abiotrophia sp.]